MLRYTSQQADSKKWLFNGSRTSFTKIWYRKYEFQYIPKTVIFRRFGKIGQNFGRNGAENNFCKWKSTKYSLSVIFESVRNVKNIIEKLTQKWPKHPQKFWNINRDELIRKTQHVDSPRPRFPKFSVMEKLLEFSNMQNQI